MKRRTWPSSHERVGPQFGSSVHHPPAHPGDPELNDVSLVTGRYRLGRAEIPQGTRHAPTASRSPSTFPGPGSSRRDGSQNMPAGKVGDKYAGSSIGGVIL